MGDKTKADEEQTTTVENQHEETATPSEEEGGAPPGAGSAALDTIANNLSKDMPDVQEHAIDQEKANEEQKLAQYSHLKDSDGNGFDPSIHKTNKAGEPTLSTKGKLIKKPGRKPGQKATTATASVVGAPGDASRPADPEAKRRLESRAAGVMSANLVLVMGIAVGGDEWQPMKDEAIGLDEKSNLENAFADYFEATGKTDIPPGLALTVAIGSYALPRFTMPKTKTRLGRAKEWAVKWWANRKLKKHNLKAESK